jgi:DNA primase
MPTTWVDFKALRSKLRFEAVLKHYNVPVNRDGDQHSGPCPLPNHQGKKTTASFSANLEKGVFQCFGCKAKGNVLEFCALMAGVNPEDAPALRKVALQLQDTFDLSSDEKPSGPGKSERPQPESRGEEPDENVQTIVNGPLDFELKDLDPKHPYLLGRGFTAKTIEHFGLGFCSRGFFKDRVAIPLRNESGVLVGYSGRIVDDDAISDEIPKYTFPAPRVRDNKRFEFRRIDILYNAHAIKRPVDDLMIVQGFPAVWWLHQHGISASVALMGSVVSKAHLKIIDGLVSLVGRIWLMPDGTDTGRRCTETALLALSQLRPVRWVKLTDDRQPTDLSAEELSDRLGSRKNAATAIPKVRSNVEPKAGIVALANSFPALRFLQLTPDTWDPNAVDARAGTLSSGERAVLQFVLAVWNPRTPWRCGVFNALDALTIWDDPHRQAFFAWANNPWWP